MNYVKQNAEKGNVEALLSAIDSFTDHSWMPILGKEKGSILDEAVQTHDPSGLGAGILLWLFRH